MTLYIGLHGHPPSLADCESSSRRHSLSIGEYAITLVVSLCLLCAFYPNLTVISKNASSTLSTWLMLPVIAAALFALIQLVKLCSRLRQLEYMPQHMMDDLVNAGMPAVTAYCLAVKNLGRPLTGAEVETLLTYCKNDPVVYAKVKEHEKKHFCASILDHLFGW